MVAANKDLIIQKDRTFIKTIQVFDETANTAFDLTNYTIKLEIRNAPGTTVLYTFSVAAGNITVVDATHGIFSLNLTPTLSRGLSFTRAFYDLILISQAGVVTEVCEGYVTVLPNITAST